MIKLACGTKGCWPVRVKLPPETTTTTTVPSDPSDIMTVHLPQELISELTAFGVLLAYLMILLAIYIRLGGIQRALRKAQEPHPA